MLTRFTYIIHSITPSKTENERDFSLAGIYTASCRSNISVEMLSDLIFMNITVAALGRNTLIKVFVISLDSVADVVDEMESNLDAFADARDIE